MIHLKNYGTLLVEKLKKIIAKDNTMDIQVSFKNIVQDFTEVAPKEIINFMLIKLTFPCDWINIASVSQKWNAIIPTEYAQFSLILNAAQKAIKKQKINYEIFRADIRNKKFGDMLITLNRREVFYLELMAEWDLPEAKKIYSTISDSRGDCKALATFLNYDEGFDFAKNGLLERMLARTYTPSEIIKLIECEVHRDLDEAKKQLNLCR